MKKLMIALLASGYCYGMDNSIEQASDTVTGPVANVGLMENTGLTSTNTVIDNTKSLATEWKVWDILSRVLGPVQILVTSANTFVGGMMISNTNNPNTSHKWAITSTVLSGTSLVLETILSKMESRNRTINQTLRESTSQITVTPEAL